LALSRKRCGTICVGDETPEGVLDHGETLATLLESDLEHRSSSAQTPVHKKNPPEMNIISGGKIGK
jgi:hypothetical protein